MKSIRIIIGNGFLFDYLFESDVKIEDWHPQKFSSWRLPAELRDGRKVMSILPHFSKYFNDYMEKNPKAVDFDVFDAIVHEKTPDYIQALHSDEFELLFNQGMVQLEARHYILRSLAWMQYQLFSQSNLMDWKWGKWLQKNSPNIQCITSFNYDLLLEQALQEHGVTYFRAALSNGVKDGIPIHKPHGSIDFESMGISAVVDYPLSILIDRNNMPVRKVDDLMKVSIDAEIVLPAEATSIAHFQWVQSGVDIWKQQTSHIEHLILVGLSYWKCDQDELDTLTDSLPKSTTIHMCNPYPSQEWIEKLQRRFKTVKVHHGLPNI